MGQRQLRAVDGFTFGVYEALPEGEAKGAVVVIQEIFGVNSHIREVADGYAAAGYAALAPQIFDRVERDVELGYEGDDMTRGMGLAFQGLAREDAMKDLQATIEEAGKYGKVGVVGYCFGGLMTWLSACDLSGIACASAYYGGGIAGELERSAKCPV
ncbi:MAG: dienelactone hydrolase family protein, partial [Gammaproteobacteria bacterium]|nr:dienelactone hydrolase family protein [Gammaproteobacteria bacterium]